MKKLLVAFPAIGLALASCASLPEPERRLLYASIDHSEWGEPNQLRLDLESGEYLITPGYWTTERLRGQQRGEKRRGLITSSDLHDLNEHPAIADADELVDTHCLQTPRIERGGLIIVSNGGPKNLSLQLEGQTLEAKGDLECWSEKALDLSHRVEELFYRPRGR